MGVGPITRFVGIDFSAAQDAADRTWITVATGDDERLMTVQLFAVRTLLERPSQPVPEALTSFIAGCGPCIIGCDACFSLPLPLVDTIWEDWLRTYPQRFPTADDLRRAGRDATGRERKRLTDRLARAPFAPTNLRLFRQTDTWLRAVLHPLVQRRAVAVAPFHPRALDRPYLLEVCPAVSLRAFQLPYRGYKGRTISARANRERILRGLQGLGLEVPSPIVQLIIAQPGGDALDSLVAAATAWLTVARNGTPSDLPDPARREGWIYVPDPRSALARER